MAAIINYRVRKADSNRLADSLLYVKLDSNHGSLTVRQRGAR
jgi:hypothetical protein